MSEAREPASTKKERYTITLSKRSTSMFRELKEHTDADTDSEVFRNALRLSYAIMKAQQKGYQVAAVSPEGQIIAPVSSDATVVPVPA